MTCSKAWFSSTTTMRWLGRSLRAGRAWAGREVTPARVDAQLIAATTATVMAAVARHLPTPAIVDPSSTPRPSHPTLAHDPAAVVPTGGHFRVPASCNLGRTSDAATGSGASSDARLRCRNPFMQLAGDPHGAGHPGSRCGTQGRQFSLMTLGPAG